MSAPRPTPVDWRRLARDALAGGALPQAKVGGRGTMRAGANGRDLARRLTPPTSPPPLPSSPRR